MYSDVKLDTVFTQKFPKHIFDYFSKLVARVKGVYTE